MNTQSILNFYNNKLSLALDNSEFYDIELVQNNERFYEPIMYQIPIEYETLIYDLSISGLTNTSALIRNRTENGWTIDMTINRNNINWYENNYFYYLGLSGSTEELNYADNNLLFEFTENKTIKWTKIHYSGTCGTNTYEESYYTLTGETPSIFFDEPDKDFKVTITFKRYYTLEDCDLENMGGINDLIINKILLNDINDVINSEEPEYEYEYRLNQKWFNERNYRLGVLKIYINGHLIYIKNNWEEIIPRSVDDFPFVQLLGGGIDVTNEYFSESMFNIKNVKYYEEPLNFILIKHNHNLE